MRKFILVYILGIVSFVLVLFSSSAQAQKVTSQIRLTVSIDGPCDSSGYCTHVSGQIHVDWTRDGNYPFQGPSPNGYWTGAIFGTGSNPKVCNNSVGVYSGSCPFWLIQGGGTYQGMLNILLDLVDQDDYELSSNFVNPSNDVVTITDDPSLAQVYITPEPVDVDQQPRPQQNPSCTADPVYLHSGQFYYQCQDLSIPGRNLDLNIGHTYFSGTSFNGPFGYGWFLNLYSRLHVV